MSSNFSANQYNDAFKPQRLQNWCQPKQPTKVMTALLICLQTYHSKASTARQGRTTFIADNRGYLLHGKSKRGSAWPDFKGTWDLPARIPAQRINPTARSQEGLARLKAWGLDPQHVDKSGPLRGSKNTRASQDARKQSMLKSGGVQQDGAVSDSLAPSAADAQQAPQSRPVSADTTGKRGQQTQADEVSSVKLPAADRQKDGETVTSRPQSQKAI
ncbi:protein Flattop isoform X2 [Syngnathus acus]|uniref:protein Flattop isoform X2 n=1 Tax=Syngnathus acus TaxID=161584 RepID=UPI001885B592|nr:protein Flattop isoform X2 [Syngnathus acus]